MTPAQRKRTTVRLPEEVAVRVDLEAARDLSSINREIVVLLTEALDARAAAAGK